jgi:hypothetical protein
MGLLVLIETPQADGFELGAVVFVHGKTVSVTGGTPLQEELQVRAKRVMQNKIPNGTTEIEVARRVIGSTGYSRCTDLPDTADNRATVEKKYPNAIGD